MTESEAWWAKGVLFENCNCALLCRAHIHYSNLCDHERCVFSWAIHIDEGAFGACPLDNLNAFIVGDTPQRMIDGGWTEAICLDAAAEAAQRQALDQISRGRAGGPWSVLAGFVSTWIETRTLPMRYTEAGRSKALEMGGRRAVTTEPIGGAERGREVKLVNLFNQIHGPEHVLARGSASYADGPLVMATDKSHAITSRFSWSAP